MILEESLSKWCFAEEEIKRWDEEEIRCARADCRLGVRETFEG